MRAVPVDERTTSWEIEDPTVRVFFWTADDTRVDTVEVSGEHVQDVLEWARAESVTRSARIELAVVVRDESDALGLVWILGDGRGGRFQDH